MSIALISANPVTDLLIVIGLASLSATVGIGGIALLNNWLSARYYRRHR